jgi:hypothetical protein
LALEKFNVKNEKSKTDSVKNIELIDNVILFGDSNTYGILAEKKKLSIFHKHLIETYLSDLNLFRLDSQMMTNFKCFKKFCNLKNSLLSKENEYRNECSLAFEEVYLFRHSSRIVGYLNKKRYRLIQYQKTFFSYRSIFGGVPLTLRF